MLRAPRAPAPDAFWIDRHERVHTYLRISVTDRCNLRCQYCMPEEGMEWIDREEILSYEEIARLSGIFHDRGVTKIRFTGGEPLARKDVPALVGMIHGRCPEASLHMTTNAVLLGRNARALRAAGLEGLNVSLDSLDPETFAKIVRRDRLADALEGIETAWDLGFRPLKINCVVLRETNLGEVPDFVALTETRPLDVRFLEYMPYGHANELQPEYVSGEEIRTTIEDAGYELESLPWDGGPARPYRVPGHAGTLGFITAVSHHFCDACNRLRLTADGYFVNCLYGEKRLDLKPLLRGGASDGEIADAILAELEEKWEAHPDLTQGEIPVLGSMSQIGG